MTIFVQTESFWACTKTITFSYNRLCHRNTQCFSWLTPQCVPTEVVKMFADDWSSMHHVGSVVVIYRIMCCAYRWILKDNVKFYYVQFIKFDSFINIIHLNFTGAHVHYFLFTIYDYYVNNLEIINICQILE